MTSKISTAYDAIVTKAIALFPSKQRLHNPYELTDNPELISRDSWGLKVGSASRIDMEYCSLSMGREFRFLLIKQFATVGSKEDAFDSVSKGLLEDQQTFLNNVNSPTELGQSTIIDQIEIDEVTGIEFMQKDQKKYLFCEIAFRITISENVI